MARPNKQKKVENEQRRIIVAEMYMRGSYQSEIAKRFGVTQTTISNDLAAIRLQWRASAIRNFDEIKSQELAKVDDLERIYQQAWEQSCTPKEIQTTEKTTDGGGGDDKLKAALRKEGRDGNPEFLKGVERCREQRAKILGLYAPEKKEITGKDGGPIRTRAEDLSDDDLARIIASAATAIPSAASSGSGSDPAAAPAGTEQPA